LQKEIKVLIYGIGNPGRGDDGLGPRLIARLQEEGGAAADLEIRYQLNIEEALKIKDYDVVVFVDASKEIDSPWKFLEIEPSETIAFTTHQLAPESVLALSQELYGRTPKAFALAIKGYDWDLGQTLSEEAEKNLSRALECLTDFLKSPRMALN
jgi:hydrogenase maturation protease